ncbi:transposase [Sphaerochaeta sp. UBA5836]|uniref:transposase n=1 Tax=Sphaerochaeta sp. UBA5836 TaxID=1947474 RepID=UPI0025D58913|nr:transposase [Sphaerochaeta sp. UBA5836]
MKNQIHGMLLGYGIATKAAQLQSNKKRQALVKDFADQGFTEAAASLEVILGIIEGVQEQIKDLDKRFCGDFKRFASNVGIVPSVHNSNETVHMGRITKHGPQELRTAFVQATMGMIRLSKITGEWRLMTDYRAMKTGKGSGKSIIATTRKLARIIFAMLHNREPFNPALMVREQVSIHSRGGHRGLI